MNIQKILKSQVYTKKCLPIRKIIITLDLNLLHSHLYLQRVVYLSLTKRAKNNPRACFQDFISSSQTQKSPRVNQMSYRIRDSPGNTTDSKNESVNFSCNLRMKDMSLCLSIQHIISFLYFFRDLPTLPTLV